MIWFLCGWERASIMVSVICDIRMRTLPDNLTTSRKTTRSCRHSIPYRSAFQFITSNYCITHVSSTSSRSHEKLSSASVDPVLAQEPLNRSSGSNYSASFFLPSWNFFISPFSRGESSLMLSFGFYSLFYSFLFRRESCFVGSSSAPLT